MGEGSRPETLGGEIFFKVCAVKTKDDIQE